MKIYKYALKIRGKEQEITQKEYWERSIPLEEDSADYIFNKELRTRQELLNLPKETLVESIQVLNEGIQTI